MAPSLLRLVMFILLVASAGLATAQDSFGTSLRQDPFFNLTAGEVGVADDLERSQRYGLEYRGQPISRYSLIPSIGYTQSGGDADFVYTEVRRDFRLSGRLLFIPSFGVGSFSDGEEIRLGHTLEFRSGVEIAYRFTSQYRLGVAVFHLSNGGIAEQNPGTESVVLSLSIPLRG